MQNGSIDLTTVKEKNAFKKAENGRHYLNFTIVPLKEVDKFGNTHTVYVSQSKAQREAKEEKIYIGKCKEILFNDSYNPPLTVSTVDDAVVVETENDLPF